MSKQVSSTKIKQEITLEDIYKEVVKIKKLITGRNNRLTRDIRMWQRRCRRLQENKQEGKI